MLRSANSYGQNIGNEKNYINSKYSSSVVLLKRD